MLTDREHEGCQNQLHAMQFSNPAFLPISCPLFGPPQVGADKPDILLASPLSAL
jgi:hypothetical protein